ncbi:MAG: hypothetical protein HYX84_02605 [Chloroflexi bacterium]|nr:hypothetical protein [Chloroflexota bacterium]
MQIKVDNLREALKLLQPAVPRKPTLEVLSNVLLKDGMAIATDLEVGISIQLHGVDGECLVPARPVLEMLKYVPGNVILELEYRDKKLHLSWDDGAASYDTAEPGDYPGLPDIPPKAEGSIDGDELVMTLVAVVKYCSKENARPVLTGVALTLGETIEAAAADGFRLAYKSLKGSYPTEETVIISSAAVRVLAEVWKQRPATPAPGRSLVGSLTGKRNINLGIGEGKLVIRYGQVTFRCNLIEGNFPDYRRLVPTGNSLHVTTYGPELETAVRRLKDMARGGNGAVGLEWSSDELTLSARHDDNTVTAKVGVRAEGGEGRTAINIAYLLEYLKGKDGMVTFAAAAESGTSPLLFEHSASPNVLLMPMVFEHKPEGQPANEKPGEPTEETGEGDQGGSEEETDAPIEEEGTPAQKPDSPGRERTRNRKRKS